MLFKFFLFACLSIVLHTFSSMHDDLLNPYTNVNRYGVRHPNKKRSLNLLNVVNSTYEVWKSHVSSNILPITDTKYV